MRHTLNLINIHELCIRSWTNDSRGIIRFSGPKASRFYNLTNILLSGVRSVYECRIYILIIPSSSTSASRPCTDTRERKRDRALSSYNKAIKYRNKQRRIDDFSTRMPRTAYAFSYNARRIESAEQTIERAAGYLRFPAHFAITRGFKLHSPWSNTKERQRAFAKREMGN